MASLASLLPSATQDEIEEELEFQDVLISSLDPGSDDYAERLTEIEHIKRDLEGRLKRLQSGSRPQTAQSQNHTNGMDGAYDQSSTSWQATLQGRPGSKGTHNSNSPYAGSHGLQTNSMKRSLPPSAYSLQPSKRPTPTLTPEPSNAATPTSSVDSFELIENPNSQVNERTLRRQLPADEQPVRLTKSSLVS